MLSSLGRLALVRAAALLVALATSGVAEALPRGEVVPHRCTCRAHGDDHVCACRVCNAAARRARESRTQATAEALPPCHRAAGRAALEAEARRERLPSILPSCGLPSRAEAALARPEPFPLPAGPPLSLAEWSTRLDGPAAPSQGAPPAPEPPPPRRA
jgi:hypothetical protein